MKSNITIKAKHCKLCSRLIRQHNKSGLCEHCYRINRDRQGRSDSLYVFWNENSIITVPQSVVDLIIKDYKFKMRNKGK